MPRGIFKHPPQCGYQKGHKNFLTKESIERRAETQKRNNKKRGQCKKCEICGEIFFRTLNDRDRLWDPRRFCSLRCKGVASRGTHKSKEWKEKMSKIMMGNTQGFVKGKPSPRKGKKSSVPAWNKGMKMPQQAGENHWNWIEDRNVQMEKHRLKTSTEYIGWRKEVFSRDNYVCQKYKTKGEKLHPHHIFNFADYPELRFDVNNGITLSEKAHKEFHKKYGVKNNTREQLEEFLND